MIHNDKQWETMRNNDKQVHWLHWYVRLWVEKRWKKVSHWKLCRIIQGLRRSSQPKALLMEQFGNEGTGLPGSPSLQDMVSVVSVSVRFAVSYLRPSVCFFFRAGWLDSQFLPCFLRCHRQVIFLDRELQTSWRHTWCFWWTDRILRIR